MLDYPENDVTQRERQNDVKAGRRIQNLSKIRNPISPVCIVLVLLFRSPLANRKPDYNVGLHLIAAPLLLTRCQHLVLTRALFEIRSNTWPNLCPIPYTYGNRDGGKGGWDGEGWATRDRQTDNARLDVSSVAMKPDPLMQTSTARPFNNRPRSREDKRHEASSLFRVSKVRLESNPYHSTRNNGRDRLGLGDSRLAEIEPIKGTNSLQGRTILCLSEWHGASDNCIKANTTIEGLPVFGHRKEDNWSVLKKELS